jgi:5-methylcytosine-specific restriction endonuclease McrA
MFTMKTDDEVRQAIQDSTSVRQALMKLDLKPIGGNYRIIKRRIKQLGLDTSHHTGKGHLKGKTHNWATRTPLDEILKENSNYQSYGLKKRLLSEGRLTNECAECKLGSAWNGKVINHHLDHINGDNTDNRIENLRLLCPNCHSQTDTYAGKNK